MSEDLFQPGLKLAVARVALERIYEETPIGTKAHSLARNALVEIGEIEQVPKREALPPLPLRNDGPGPQADFPTLDALFDRE
ncbi:MAG: hypothetical protein K1Y36_06775 [Blastocatellia bacterium]|nr:hypothetical protein [Blastocatellia bacterium]